MSSSGLAAVILNFRLPVASESIGATTIKKFDVENGGGNFLNFVASLYRTGDIALDLYICCDRSTVAITIYLLTTLLYLYSLANNSIIMTSSVC